MCVRVCLSVLKYKICFLAPTHTQTSKHTKKRRTVITGLHCAQVGYFPNVFRLFCNFVPLFVYGIFSRSLSPSRSISMSVIPFNQSRVFRSVFTKLYCSTQWKIWYNKKKNGKKDTAEKSTLELLPQWNHSNFKCKSDWFGWIITEQNRSYRKKCGWKKCTVIVFRNIFFWRNDTKMNVNLNENLFSVVSCTSANLCV